ncbi:MAG: AraC family transcriptional regulator [Prevotellaceae bacterium]|jgi:AraC-like DNA-binding protein/mannose-6-phosphate isomerase-like protein (cupin superfamily)|nr:AraC family transcriptional regulator [Prevotellaceae bacterium]
MNKINNKHPDKKLFSNGEIRHSSMQNLDSFYIRKPEEGQHHLSKTQMQPVRAGVNCFFFLTEGKVVVDIGVDNYVICKNECVIIPAGQIFTIKSHEQCKGYMGGFHNDFLLAGLFGNNFLKRFDFLSMWGNYKTVLSNEEANCIIAVFQRLFVEFHNAISDNDVIRAYLIALLSEINRIYKKTSTKKLNSAEKITNRFKEILFNSPQKKMSVAEYASLLNITPNHLNKTIKNTTGKSPSEWIIESVITEAKILLYQTNLTVSEISENTGILDQSYFSRIFRKHEGVSPVEFRKMIEKS